MNNEIKCPKCGEIFQVDETLYTAIVKQVRDKEFQKDLKDKEAQFEKDKQNLLLSTKLEMGKTFDKELNAKKAEIIQLKSEIKSAQIAKQAEINKIISEKDNEVNELKYRLETFNKDKEREIANIVVDMNNKLSAQEKFILKITNESELAEKEHKLREQSLKEKYETEIKFKNDEIERLKDYKLKLSTKMIGESLEQHCEIEFEKLHATGFKAAYFEKDNEVKSGSKGDYIYRDYDSDGNEFISIMFEMKNEADTETSDTTSKTVSQKQKIKRCPCKKIFEQTLGITPEQIKLADKNRADEKKEIKAVNKKN